MMIRELTYSDVRDVKKLCLDLATRYDHITPDESKIEDQLRKAFSSRQHYTRVIYSKGQITGILLALSLPHPWGRKNAAQIAVWDGNPRVMRDFLRWKADRTIVRYATIVFDFDAQMATRHFLRSVGFEKAGDTYIHKG